MTSVDTSPGVAAANPGTKPFLHTTLAHRNANPLSLLTQPDDPTRFLRELQGFEAGSVKRIGTESVRDAKATHLSLRMDLDQAAAKQVADVTIGDAPSDVAVVLVREPIGPWNATIERMIDCLAIERPRH